MSHSNATSIYQSPLTGRYATQAMQSLFSAQQRYKTWRQIWIALAEAEQELGLNIKAEQIAELKRFANQLNLEVAAAKEKELRHDVMAHVHAYAEQCPQARAIIHLGATSCTITDNADLLLMREGMRLLCISLANVVDHLAKFAKEYRDLPTLAYTHLQPAQPTTVGKRACLWMQDLLMDLANLQHRINEMPCLGAKGTTGTQASFLDLFAGDQQKVQKLDQLLAKKLGFSKSIAVSGQTYARKWDDQILCALSGIGQSAAKFAADIRILSHNREIEEPFEEHSQIGSSAMPYKQNPMRCERMSGLARFLTTLPLNTSATASAQWLERTLDDSANRRLIIPEAFLTADAILNIYLNVAAGLRVYPQMIRKHLQEELPFMATEELLMKAVQAGGDRQALHEKIRQHAVEVARNIKEKGLENDLLLRLKKESAFSKIMVDIETAADLPINTGRAPQQVDEFLQQEVVPALQPFKNSLGQKGRVEL